MKDEAREYEQQQEEEGKGMKEDRDGGKKGRRKRIDILAPFSSKQMNPRSTFLRLSPPPSPKPRRGPQLSGESISGIASVVIMSGFNRKLSSVPIDL